MIEQLHPECRERFVIQAAHAMMGGERANVFTHAREGFVRRQLVEIAQRHSDVRNMRELRRRNGRGFKSLDQRENLGVAGKVSRLQENNL